MVSKMACSFWKITVDINTIRHCTCILQSIIFCWCCHYYYEIWNRYNIGGSFGTTQNHYEWQASYDVLRSNRSTWKTRRSIPTVNCNQNCYLHLWYDQERVKKTNQIKVNTLQFNVTFQKILLKNSIIQHYWVITIFKKKFPVVKS